MPDYLELCFEHLEKVSDISLKAKAKNILELCHHGSLQFRHEPVMAIADGAVLYEEVLLRVIDKNGEKLNTEDVLHTIHQANLSCWFELFLIEEALSKNISHPYSCGVNISPFIMREQETRTNLHDLVTEAYAKGLLRYDIYLEMTEKTTFENLLQAKEVLGAFKGRGFYLCIDDFGSGYNDDIEIVKQLPVHVVKLDGSLVKLMLKNKHKKADMAVIDYCVKHNIDIVAEHVDTVDEALMLATLGITHVQSYNLNPSDFEK